jgi:hypothetical protein
VQELQERLRAGASRAPGWDWHDLQAGRDSQGDSDDGRRGAGRAPSLASQNGPEKKTGKGTDTTYRPGGIARETAKTDEGVRAPSQQGTGVAERTRDEDWGASRSGALRSGASRSDDEDEKGRRSCGKGEAASEGLRHHESGGRDWRDLQAIRDSQSTRRQRTGYQTNPW